MAKLLIVIGLIVVALGVLLHFAPGALSWFGRLPGDIRIEGKNGAFYFPLMTMIIVSVVLSLVIHWLNR